MNEIVKYLNPLVLFSWLKKPMLWWMKVKLLPENLPGELNLNKDQPVVYIMSHWSFSDFLVLQHFCRKSGLPVPTYSANKFKNKNGPAGYLYLAKTGLLQVKRDGSPPTPLQNLCNYLSKDLSAQVQLVPVSIIWGRNPGSEGQSLWKVLFSDDEHAGILQKLLIILAQGRDTLVHFGKPISMREQIDNGPSPEQTARKIRRVLKVHFRTQRNNALGPKIYDRARLLSMVFNSHSVQQAISQEAVKKGEQRSKVEVKARYYLREIASMQSHRMIKFFDIVLTFVWNRIYKGIYVRNSKLVRELNNKREIIYVSSHRSHLDYLVMPYELYYMGLRPPHAAAGINLSFWPLGVFLRRGGAFFIRRSFKGNRLYASVFTEYLNVLMLKGFPILYFPEGGRSRTGRLLAPKTGMLSMIVQGYLKDPSRSVALVPVYIGYDKVAEVSSYLKELRGAKKQKESFLSLLGARRILKTQFGKAYVGFGDSIDLDEYLDKHCSGWRQETHQFDTRPAWYTQMIQELAVDLMRGINAAAIVNPVSLVAVAMLSNPQRAMAEEELIDLIKLLIELQTSKDGSLENVCAVTDPKKVLEDAEAVAPINRFAYPDGGDVIYLNEVDSVLMSYYRNNVLHLFALPSLVASFFQYNDQVKIDELVDSCLKIYPFIVGEFFLEGGAKQIEERTKQVIETLVNERVLKWTDDRSALTRAEVGSDRFCVLKSLGRCLGLVFERYSISTAMLAGFIGAEPVLRSDFEKKCQLLAQRISILSGVNDPEFYDKSLFHGFIDMLKREGYLHEEAGKLVVDESMRELATRTSVLLSADISQSIRRVTEFTN